MTSENGTVPFLDLVEPHLVLEEEIVSVLRDTLHTARFIGGPMVEGFERDFAAFCQTAYCVGVASGTDALRFALIAAGVSPGDAVLTVPNTFIATSEAISQVGAIPEFVDIHETTCNMDPERLREVLEVHCRRDERTGRPVSPRTGRTITAVVPVHLYGQMAPMDPILEIAARYGLAVIEDACQAHGAEYASQRDGRWHRAGSMGVAAAFSFYPGKNLGACGEAGAVTTHSEAIAQTVRCLRDHGQIQKYHHEMEGYNGRLDAVQAGILGIKLKYLEGWNAQRRERADTYRTLLQGIEGIELPAEPNWAQSVYHLFVIRSRTRDALQRYLLDERIHCALHYPVPLHLQKAYGGLGYREGDFPVAERLAAEILSLPMYPHLRLAQQQRVAERIGAFFAAGGDRVQTLHPGT